MGEIVIFNIKNINDIPITKKQLVEMLKDYPDDCLIALYSDPEISKSQWIRSIAETQYINGDKKHIELKFMSSPAPRECKNYITYIEE